MLSRAFACNLLAAALAGQSEEPRLLAQALRADPFELLRAIGTAKSVEAAGLEADKLREKLGEDYVLRDRLLRLGLGAADEAVVFGAAVLNSGQCLPVPELRHAAKVVVPRFGDPACPVTFDQLTLLWGSRDVPAAIVRAKVLPPDDAERWLGELHRLVRAEHVPALCDLALATTGKAQNGALSDARLATQYSGEHVPLFVATLLKVHGVTADADGEGLPGVLTAHLRWSLDHDDSAAWLLSTRWLLASRAGAKDLPLLQRVIEKEGPIRWWRVAALRALGALRDADSEALLRRHAAGEDEGLRRAARTALAARGDAEALAALFVDGDDESLASALSVAPADERTAFCKHLLAAPAADALDVLQRLQRLGTDVYPPTTPPFDDAWLPGIEDLAFRAELEAGVLFALVGFVPQCATRRLADKLLAHPAKQLFAAARDQITGGPGWWHWARGDTGFAGTFPFLEVTAPDALRARLREGFALDDPRVSDLCGELLLRLGDQQSARALLDWVRREPDLVTTNDPWLLLASCGGGEPVRSFFASKLRGEDGGDTWHDDAVRALAVCHGMPVEVAAGWCCDAEHQTAVLAALRAGDAAAAWLADEPQIEDAAGLLQIAPWKDARIRAFAQKQRESIQRTTDSPTEFALRMGIGSGNRDAIAVLRDLLHDGRYATHHAFGETDLTLGRDLGTLPFWIGEYGTNCCRCCVAGEAMGALFGEGPEYFADLGEPALQRLRRRLLPLVHRLKWSVLANSHVVAGG